MSKTIEEYLRIIYPDIEKLSQEQKRLYENDKTFLLEFFKEFEENYNKNIKRINEKGEKIYTKTILKMTKKMFDKATIIDEYVEGILYGLNRNSYIYKNYDEFMKLMQFERHQEEEMMNVEVDNTPIELTKVFSLTEEFLGQIDTSGEMLAEFRKLKSEGKIQFLFPDDKKKESSYKNGKIEYASTGTMETASTLVHEFFHHWGEIKAHPNRAREEHSMFLEFESIYYENAFIRFMNDKGMLKKGEQPLRAIRLKREYEKDPENCILMLLTLGSYLNKNGQLDKNAIIEALQSYYPEGTDREEVWRKCSESLLRFIDEVSFPREVVSGPILYRFNTALAMQTSLDPKTMRSVYTLSPYIKDRIYDKEFMRQYEFMRRNIADEKRKEEDKSKS